MNFKDLLEKMTELDSSAEDKYVSQPESDIDECGDMPSGVESPLMGEEGMDECGGMAMPVAASPKQSDSVNMNVSMNGSGAGGIKDLLDILRNLEQTSDADKDVVIGMEEFANEPEEKIAGVDAVTPTGDDLLSKGMEAPKVNGGGNPLGVSESLVSRLSDLYNEVKSR